jgi:hypothetical protein
MKFKISFAFMALLMAFQMSAQRETKLTLEKEVKTTTDSAGVVTTDTLYSLREIARLEGRKVSDNLVPDYGPLTKADFKTWLSNEIKGQQNILLEIQRKQTSVEATIAFLGNSLDSVYGAGAYKALESEAIQAKMQGIWQIVVRNGDTHSIPCVIQGNELISNDKKSLITWKTADSFTLAKGLFNFALTFKLADGDRYVAERTAAGVTTKYTLRR